jgi:hypothetical protein
MIAILFVIIILMTLTSGKTKQSSLPLFHQVSELYDLFTKSANWWAYLRYPYARFAISAYTRGAYSLLKRGYELVRDINESFRIIYTKRTIFSYFIIVILLVFCSLHY